MKRILWPLVAIAAIAALGGVLWLGSSLNGIVKAGVERHGPKVTGTDVKLAGAEIQLREGRGTLRGLRVRNPDGFSREDAVSFGEITLDIDTGSLTKEPLVIETIRIAGPSLLLEMSKDGVNLRVLQQHVEQYAPQQAAGDRLPRIAVRSLTVEGGTLRLDARAVGGEISERKLPALTLTDVGGTKGVPADALGQEVLRAVLSGALRGAAEEGLKDAGLRLLKGLGK